MCRRHVQVDCFGSSRSHSCHRDGTAVTPRVCTNIKRPIYAARTRQFDPGLGSGSLKILTSKVYLLVEKGPGLLVLSPGTKAAHLCWADHVRSRFCYPAYGRGRPSGRRTRENTSTNLGSDFSRNQKLSGRKPKPYFSKKSKISLDSGPGK